MPALAVAALRIVARATARALARRVRGVVRVPLVFGRVYRLVMRVSTVRYCGRVEGVFVQSLPKLKNQSRVPSGA